MYNVAEDAIEVDVAQAPDLLTVNEIFMNKLFTFLIGLIVQDNYLTTDTF
jgi:hypothetical protein